MAALQVAAAVARFSLLNATVTAGVIVA